MRSAQQVNPFIPPVLFLALCLVTYGHVLTHHLMMDDFSFLDQKNISAYYPHFLDFFIRSNDQHYDPLYNLINVSLFRHFHEAYPFYLINLSLFYSNCLLLFYFVKQVTKDHTAALLTGIIFCIHPMSGEIIQHITLNNILLATSLMLMGLMLLYQYFSFKSNIYLYLGSFFLFILSLLCHETSILFVVYASSMAFILAKYNLKDTFKLCIPFLILELVFFVLWLNLAAPKAFLSKNIQGFHMGFVGLSANYWHVAMWYIGNLFVPKDIVFMYSTAPIKDFMWFWNVLFLFFVSTVIFLIVYFKRSVESFSLILFFSGFAFAVPAFATRPQMGFVFEPYWMYFSSIGFYLFVVLMFFKAKDRINRWIWIIIWPIVLMVFFIQTQILNIRASTQLSYCENWLRQSPGNLIPAGILSQEYVLYNVDVPIEFFTPMLRMVDIDINNGRYESASKLISKLSDLSLSDSQRQDLFSRIIVVNYKSVHRE